MVSYPHIFSRLQAQAQTTSTVSFESVMFPNHFLTVVEDQVRLEFHETSKNWQR